jgi:branched-chain amino acid transport system ATP-binding protein
MSDLTMLELVDVHAAYGRIEVVRGVDLRVPRGAVVALLGPNGAGKSTLLKLASGQKQPTSGEIHLAGVSLHRATPDRLARLGLCTVPEGRSVFPNLSVEDNLRLVSFSGVRAGDVLDLAYAYFPRLAGRRHQLAGTLSGGEQQMVAMSRALASDPELLLLDELSMGLAPLVVESLYETVAQVAATGVTILLAEQFARTALAVADHALVMQNGRITRRGEPSEIEAVMTDVMLGASA